ncbi:mandelate racemase/muconate lactonizing enzyme family protein [Actinomadura sp. 6N118]|uniref:mandelate racemase/muconate lactonizing enzyme family protein n=1 Tax=Actinomadura sp. 6N118 TaxID=3375151 RepID=UPI00379946BB
METLRPAFQPNVLILRLHTEDGLTGLGESFYGATAVEAYLHDHVAPALLACRDPAPESVARLLAPYTGYQGGGVEIRAAGAVDIAMWDILGKRAGLPVAELLGGPVRDSIRVYNTCAGPGYVNATSRQEPANWGRGRGDYEDLDAFLTRPGELARELAAEGVTGMKIWPFDQAAERTGGTDISPAELAAGVRVVERIREAVGLDMALMIELHGLWNQPSAVRICRALAPFEPYWVEDPIRADAPAALAALSAETGVPIAAGETVVGRRGFLPLLTAGAVDVATVDVQWTGGLTEARKTASLADAFGIPVAPHDCTGPISFAACVHLVLSQPNGLIQETVRAFLRTWYGRLVTGLPAVTDGTIAAGGEPGLGLELNPDLTGDPATVRRVTRRERSQPAPDAVS